MINIVNLEAHTVHKNIQFSKPSFEHHWTDCYNTTPDEIIEKAIDADIIIVNKLKITEEIISSLPKLKLINIMATGTNNIDIEACKRHGIALTNLQKYGTASVAEHAISLMMLLSRNLISYRDRVNDLSWSKSNSFCLMNYPIQELSGKNLTIIGKGAIGEKLANIAEHGFGMHVIFADRKNATTKQKDRVEFNQALREADYISLHCPLTEQTKDLISYTEFAIMKPSVILVNVARGSIVNESALYQAIITNQIAGAGLDVTSQEPIPINNKLLELAKTENLIITPHCAWLGDTALKNIGSQIIENMEEFIKGAAIRRIV